MQIETKLVIIVKQEKSDGITTTSYEYIGDKDLIVAYERSVIKDFILRNLII